ncbi:MAG: flavin-dependent oxidoreductase [Burkholderiaceae bacterium]|nr:flavin-dependent oxidoreductase [Burkholderiales bacterium]MCZ8098603.1 flavin-dependent oxidoreductase [Burkholderiales bacterium]MCZ8338140.1 flavin-dependent oxidoreductase [Burkholderiaceae bacterium]
MDVAIVGGGIGGLATALALHAKGIACTVFEAVEAVRPLGVGINLLPHSVRVLSNLGLQPALAAIAVETAELAFYNKHGQPIWSEPRGLAGGYTYPQFSIHRGRLQMILFETATHRLPAGAIRTSHALSRFEEGDGLTTLHFVDRAGAPRPPVRARAVIGADGIHSVVRRTFIPDEGPARFSGRMLWRATTRARPFLTGRSMVQAGHQNQKFVCYPIQQVPDADGKVTINWIAELTVPAGTTPERENWNKKVDRSVFREPFAGWTFDWLDIPALIDGADAIFEFPMVDRDPLPRWTHGRITLLGDAAHPMYPIGSNGASQGILDAEAMADAMIAAGFPSRSTDPADAFARYEAARREATGAIVLSNRRNGPDQVMQIAEERAPQGFRHVHDVIPREELEAISARYKQLAGFSHSQVNR